MMAGCGLRLITEAPADPAQVYANLGAPQTHFGQRAQGRGITSVPGDVLRAAVRWAVRADHSEFVQHVFTQSPGKDFWRFRVDEGFFYALIGVECSPVTVYTADMIRLERERRKRNRRTRSRRGPSDG
jgi:hypothetical protein